jgi:adenine/guanine phosphoribosyltransferase-like PRPP-binding protein
VALAQFIYALRTEKAPMGEVHENLESLAIVEAALESSRTKKLVIVDDLLNHALANALKENAYPELKGTLDAKWAKEFQR